MDRVGIANHYLFRDSLVGETELDVEVKQSVIKIYAPFGGIFFATMARKSDLKIGRLLKVNREGKLICAKSRREARFIFIRYVDGLRAEVGTYDLVYL